MCMCVPLIASDSSETIEVIIIIKLGTVTVSDMLMHPELMFLTLTFIQGHTDIIHDNNKCSIIAETVQAMHITFVVEVVRRKVYIHFLSPMTLLLTQGHNCVSNLTSV